MNARFFPRLFRPLLLGAVLLGVARAQEEVTVSPDANLFGGDLPSPYGADGRTLAEAREATATYEGYTQQLVFQDGRELRGEIVGITAGEVIWKRPDASEPLRFPRAVVRRIVTAPGGRNGPVRFGGVPFNPGRTGRQPPPPPPQTTLKLPGGDWLFGKVTSADGQTFHVQLGEQAQLDLPRERIEWLQFSRTPVPAFGLSGSVFDAAGWLPIDAAPQVVNGALTVKNSSWIGRNIDPLAGFEVSFELAADAEEGTQLWLQPFSPQPNCYSTGTAVIRFGKKQISHCLYLEDVAYIRQQLPQQSLEEEGPVQYRVFCNHETKRVAVQRNGRIVGDWSFSESKGPDGKPPEERNFQFAGLCFDRQNGNGMSSPPSLTQVRVRPWNGALPKAGETAAGEDRLTGATGPVKTGRLEALKETELTFSGTAQPIEAGAFLTFPGAPQAALAEAEAKLDFGSLGEFSVRHLEAHEGKVQGETSFTRALVLPLAALQRVLFPDQDAPPPAEAAADTIVFKNGDELTGHLLSAGRPGPVRWRTASGQEVEIDTARIAGLRLAARTPAAATPPAEHGAATIELRSGERLAGRLLTLDDKQLQMEHAQLGTLTLARGRLWHLFPQPRFPAVDGGLATGGWQWNAPKTREPEAFRPIMVPAQWMQLGGVYFIRHGGRSNVYDTSTMPGLEHRIGADLERFEIRVDAVGLQDRPGNFFLRLVGQNGGLLEASLNYTQLQASITDPHKTQASSREMNLEKLGPDLRHRALRLFVDTRAGTSDFVINGVHVGHLGQTWKEQLHKTEYTVRIVPYPNEGSILSHLWVGPWNGEVPSSETEAAGGTALANGDFIPNPPKSLRAGQLAVDSELGELTFPLEKTLELDFGGTMETTRAAGRVRLTDGTTVNVEAFQWQESGFTAHSATFGDLHLPAGAVREIVYEPGAPRSPLPVLPRALAEKQAQANSSRSPAQ